MSFQFSLFVFQRNLAIRVFLQTEMPSTLLCCRDNLSFDKPRERTDHWRKSRGSGNAFGESSLCGISSACQSNSSGAAHTCYPEGAVMEHVVTGASGTECRLNELCRNWLTSQPPLSLLGKKKNKKAIISKSLLRTTSASPGQRPQIAVWRVLSSQHFHLRELLLRRKNQRQRSAQCRRDRHASLGALWLQCGVLFRVHFPA